MPVSLVKASICTSVRPSGLSYFTFTFQLLCSRAQVCWRWATQTRAADKGALVRSRSPPPSRPLRPQVPVGPGSLLPSDWSPQARQLRRTWIRWASTDYSPTHSSIASGSTRTASPYAAPTLESRRSALRLSSSSLFWYEYECSFVLN